MRIATNRCKNTLFCPKTPTENGGRLEDYLKSPKTDFFDDFAKVCSITFIKVFIEFVKIRKSLRKREFPKSI